MANKKILIDYDLDGNKIINLGNPVDPLDAIHKDFHDESFIDDLNIATYIYDSTLTAFTGANPYNFRLNNAIFASVTEMYIDITDVNSFDTSGIMSNLLINDIIQINDSSNANLFVTYKVNSITNNVTFFTISVTFVKISLAGGIIPTNQCRIKFISNISALAGGGDMMKSVYDTDNDGVVDSSERLQIEVINKTGAPLTKGTIVYLKSTSSSVNYPEALKANANSEATSNSTIGAVFTDIANDAVGYVITVGQVHNLDTSAYNVGDKLWLATSDGLVTTTKPTQPNHSVFIGTVTRSQASNGRISYNIQNGFELDELHDVLITTPLNGQPLIYESASGLWKNKSLTIGGKVAIYPHDNGVPAYYTTVDLAYAASTPGDVIVVYPGTYVTTTTATNGLAKDGISWYLYPDAILVKQTAGDMFNTTGFTSYFNIYGYGKFQKTSNTGRIFSHVVNNINVEINGNVISSTIDDCIYVSSSGSTLKLNVYTITTSASGKNAINAAYLTKLIFNGYNLNSTNGVALYSNVTSGTAPEYNITANEITSSSTYAIQANSPGSGRMLLNVNVITGVTYGIYFSDQWDLTLNTQYCTGVNYIGGKAVVSGKVDKITGSSYSGIYQNWTGGICKNINIQGGNFDVDVFDDTNSAGLTQITNSGGTLRANLIGARESIGINLTGGTTYLQGNLSYTEIYGSTQRIINGGTLIVESDITLAGTFYDTGYLFNLQSGKLLLNGKIKNNINDSSAIGIIYSGGTLVINRGTIITSNSNAFPIQSTVAGQSVKILSGGLSTNRAENGGTLAGKKQKSKFTISAVATSSITLNNNSAGAHTYTESNTGVYNTKALLAQRMAALINAGTDGVTATQDTPGTDEYFYIENNTAGYICTFTSLTNIIKTSDILLPSYALTLACGGSIIDDTNVE